MATPKLSVVENSTSLSMNTDKNQIRKVIDNLYIDNQSLMELSNKLHSTLDIEKLIILFELEITPRLNLDNVIFHTPDNLEAIDPKGRHLVSYQLNLHKKELGEISLIRRTRFSVKEQKFIEKILVALLAPLNNALDYQNALNSAQRDPLTGVYNRFAMESSFPREIELAQRNQTPLSLMVLDIDFFKKVNDTYGHAIGDSVIKHLTQCVMACDRHSDMLFRYGGEEFMLLLNNTNREGAELLAERIRQTIENTPCICGDQTISITASIGISTYIAQDTRESLFERADKGLYQAKETGRNRVVFAS